MDVVLLDYGVGNLHSLASAFSAEGADVRLASDPALAAGADAIVLPGVGAFGSAADRLAAAAAPLRDALQNGQPCLAICLGMQLLFESSDEAEGAGLGVMRGRVRRLEAPRVPHMGWNDVTANEDPLFQGLDPLLAYYANSYVAEPADPSAVIAWTDYAGSRFPAAVRRLRTWGVQFHPEKSGAAGRLLIRNFLRQVRR